MSEPRLYLYRKAGRTVWDAEMWLPDGRRKTWRTGVTDRVQAQGLAHERLSREVVAAASPATGIQDTEAEPDRLIVDAENLDVGVAPAPASAGDRCRRFDRWFFDDLKQLLFGV